MTRSYSCSLASLLRELCCVPAGLDTRISGLSIDSRKVQKGDLFIAVSKDGDELSAHISEAISNGANAILKEGDSRIVEDGRAVELYLSDLDKKVGIIADRFFQSPSKDIAVIGVTGTNGKTSVASYLANYFTLGGSENGVIGTLGYGLVGEGRAALIDTGHTTPNAVDVHRHLASLRDQGVKTVSMEVSSHGLAQGRVDEVTFTAAVYTNLTRDHLDYHGSMAAYADAKKKLFISPELKFAVLNKDDDYFHEIQAVLPASVKVLTYGVEDQSADVAAISHEFDQSELKAVIKTHEGQVSLRSQLLGAFNLSNLLAVIGVALALRDTEKMESRLAALKAVDGRMEVIRHEQSPLVVVDYAHTPDALANVLSTLKESCQGKLRLVFGCGGDRDKGKRAEMAKIAEQYADQVILTDDNPRSEAPELIVQDILSGFSAKESIEVIHDRRNALRSVLNRAAPKDMVLVAGKGHECWQEQNGEKRYFSDVGVVNELLTEHQAQESQGREALHD